jgi:hypothetical protein
MPRDVTGEIHRDCEIHRGRETIDNAGYNISPRNFVQVFSKNIPAIWFLSIPFFAGEYTHHTIGQENFRVAVYEGPAPSPHGKPSHSARPKRKAHCMVKYHT